MKIEYHLEVHAPESSHLLASHTSETPFGAISVGDTIKTMTEKDVRVTHIRHIIWEIEDSHIGHKICVFTEPWSS